MCSDQIHCDTKYFHISTALNLPTLHRQAWLSRDVVSAKLCSCIPLSPPPTQCTTSHPPCIQIWDRAQGSHSFHKDISHQIISCCYSDKYLSRSLQILSKIPQKTIKLITWLVQSPCYAKATQDDSHHLLIIFNIFSQPLTFNAHWHFTSPPNEGQLCSSLLPKRILRGRTMVTARMSPIKTAINTLALAQETTWKRDHHLFGHMEN